MLSLLFFMTTKVILDSQAQTQVETSIGLNNILKLHISVVLSLSLIMPVGVWTLARTV